VEYQPFAIIAVLDALSAIVLSCMYLSIRHQRQQFIERSNDLARDRGRGPIRTFTPERPQADGDRASDIIVRVVSDEPCLRDLDPKSRDGAMKDFGVRFPDTLALGNQDRIHQRRYSQLLDFRLLDHSRAVGDDAEFDASVAKMTQRVDHFWKWACVQRESGPEVGMEASHLRLREVELDADGFVEDSFVYPAQVVKSDYSINITLTRNVSEYIAQLFMLKMCKSMDGAGAIPQRPVQIEKDCPRGHACCF